MNSSLAKVEAVKAGYDEAIMLGTDGRVSECTGENLFIVRDGLIVSPPPSEAGALSGVTQASVVQDRAATSGYPVSFEAMRRDDLYLADEAFLTGTAAEVVPIASVDDRVDRRRASPVRSPRQIQSHVLPGGARRASRVRELADQGLSRRRVASTRDPTDFLPRVRQPARSDPTMTTPAARDRSRAQKPGLLRSRCPPPARAGRGTPAPGEGYALDDRRSASARSWPSRTSTTATT